MRLHSILLLPASYNVRTGLLTAQTDANGQNSSFQYGTYNRRTREDLPNGGWTSSYYVDDFDAGKYRSYVRTYRKHTATEPVAVDYGYFDGLGRLLRSIQVESTSPTVLLRVDREYELCSCTGKTARVSLPYRSGDPIDWTETRYDGLGRVRQVIPPDGSASANFTEYRYAWTTLSVPGSALPLRMRIEAVFDASGVGRLREVREDASSLDLSSWRNPESRNGLPVKVVSERLGSQTPSDRLPDGRIRDGRLPARADPDMTSCRTCGRTGANMQEGCGRFESRSAPG